MTDPKYSLMKRNAAQEEVDDEDPCGSSMTRLITNDLLLYKMNQREAEDEEDQTFG